MCSSTVFMNLMSIFFLFFLYVGFSGDASIEIFVSRKPPSVHWNKGSLNAYSTLDLNTTVPVLTTNTSVNPM
jgi:hypothetical protein